MFTQKVVIAGLILLTLRACAFAQNNPDDPYVILNNYFKAMGGLDRLKAEQSSYFEAEISFGGFEGTLKIWEQQPGYSRYEVDLGIFNVLQGKNDKYEWTLDQNGKLQKTTNFDDVTIKRKDIKKRIEKFEYANPKSEIFKVTYEGVQAVDGKDCYVIKIANNICWDNLTYFINADNYMLEKSISIEGTESNDAFYSDYREIDGLMVAYSYREIVHKTGQDQVIYITKYLSNPKIDSVVFEAPDVSSKDYRFENGNSSENIPIRFVEEHIYVPVIIDCRETIWVLDTGSGLSFITEKLTNALGLDLQGEIKGAGAGGLVDVHFTTLPSFNIPGVIFDEQTVGVMNLDELNKMLPLEIDGILGYDFLSRFVTKVD